MSNAEKDSRAFGGGTEGDVAIESQETVMVVGICKLRETGNATTLDRIRSHVEDGGWKSLLRDPGDLDMTSMKGLVKKHNIVAVIALHLYRSGHVMQHCRDMSIPYVAVFAGTDLNQCVTDETKMTVMRDAALSASHLIAFTSDMRNKALALWPTLDPEAISVLPQAVTVNPDVTFDVNAYLIEVDKLNHKNHGAERSDERSENSRNDSSKHNKNKNNNYNSSPSKENRIKENGIVKNDEQKEENEKLKQNNLSLSGSDKLCNSSTTAGPEIITSNDHNLPKVFQPLVVLVAGLRPVKDVLYVADIWSKWQESQGGNGRLIIVGPSLDDVYASHVIAHSHRLNGVRVVDPLLPQECQALIGSASALLNSSISEGMSAALLEAMALGTPVVARDIPGNSAVVAQGKTGLLFSTPESFLQQLQALHHDPALRKRLVTCARHYVNKHHSACAEGEAFISILHRMRNDGRQRTV